MAASARALSLLLGALGICGAALLWQALAGRPVDGAVTSMAVREGLAAFWLLPACGVLLLMVLAQTAARFLSGKNDAALGRDGPLLVGGQFAITDTVEQMAIFAPCFLALAAGAPADWMPRVLALGGVFALARAAVWLGALAAPLGRAPGRAASLAVCAATAAAAAWAWL